MQASIRASAIKLAIASSVAGCAVCFLADGAQAAGSPTVSVVSVTRDCSTSAGQQMFTLNIAGTELVPNDPYFGHADPPSTLQTSAYASEDFTASAAGSFTGPIVMKSVNGQSNLPTSEVDGFTLYIRDDNTGTTSNTVSFNLPACTTVTTSPTTTPTSTSPTATASSTPPVSTTSSAPTTVSTSKSTSSAAAPATVSRSSSTGVKYVTDDYRSTSNSSISPTDIGLIVGGIVLVAMGGVSYLGRRKGTHRG